MKAIIFANGIIASYQAAQVLIQPEDVIIAADGGTLHCREMDLTPDTIIGDLDSLPPEELSHWQGLGVEIIQHDPRKNETDLELALLLAQAQEQGEALVLGGLGGRWDHTFANIFLPAYHKLKNLNVTFWHDGLSIYLVRGTRQIRGIPGQVVSLLPLAGDAKGIRTEGLEYPLNNETLLFGASRGVSNILLGETATISLKEGLLLCFVTQQEP